MREILAREHPDARLALGVHHHRLAAAVAGMAAAMGGIDVLAFTGGVGENAVPVRAAAAAQLGFLAVGIDAAGNGVVAGDGDITATGATVSTVVVAAREDIEMARQARELLST